MTIDDDQVRAYPFYFGQKSIEAGAKMGPAFSRGYDDCQRRGVSISH
jgi:hypothetical protein